MKQSRRILLVVACGLLFVVAGCGGGRELISISISPATADGANYPLGGVQFTATGTFNKPPTTVTPLSATWSIMPVGVATIETNTGFAQCTSTGTATVNAGVPVSSGMFHTGVFGSATLTCP